MTLTDLARHLDTFATTPARRRATAAINRIRAAINRIENR